MAAANIAQRIHQFHDIRQTESLRALLNSIYDRLSSVSLTSAALAGTAVTVPSTGAAWVASINGILVQKATSTAMPALVGTVTNAKFNVYAFFVNSAGTVVSAMGTEAATLAGVVFPPIPVNQAVLGFIVVNPTGTGNFVGGTTNLNDVTVVPNVVFVNVVGAFDITALTDNMV